LSGRRPLSVLQRLDLLVRRKGFFRQPHEIRSAGRATEARVLLRPPRRRGPRRAAPRTARPGPSPGLVTDQPPESCSPLPSPRAGGLALSLGSAFIENGDDPGAGSQQQRKQECELKALDRAAAQIKRDFPQARFCLSGDSEFGCGRVLQLCKDKRWSYLLVFKPGRTPARYEGFQALLRLCPANRLLRESDGVSRLYRWVEAMRYEDSVGRQWVFNAVELQETVAGGTTTFAWITDLKVKEGTAGEVAASARERGRIENEGFNRQKNSGLNLGHVYSIDPDKLHVYYLLLQTGHILPQLLEKGSLLRQLAASMGKTPWRWPGSLTNLAKRLLEGLRFGTLPEEIESVGQVRFAAWNTA
jgi:hypothetical protein